MMLIWYSYYTSCLLSYSKGKAIGYFEIEK